MWYNTYTNYRLIDCYYNRRVIPYDVSMCTVPLTRKVACTCTSLWTVSCDTVYRVRGTFHVNTATCADRCTHTRIIAWRWVICDTCRRRVMLLLNILIIRCTCKDYQCNVHFYDSLLCPCNPIAVQSLLADRESNQVLSMVAYRLSVHARHLHGTCTVTVIRLPRVLSDWHINRTWFQPNKRDDHSISNSVISVSI